MLRKSAEGKVVYQIYPRSFKDSNGDGIGDIKGITEGLSYLSYLGVDAIWLSPVYPSPMVDFGYDISDFCNIDPLFGTLTDFDELVNEAHKRHLEVIMDFVPNHSSSLHPWFIASRSSLTDEKRAWYIWSDPKPDGSPPNNWLSYFGGSAWELDPLTNQYYYHAFAKEQPDLNWRNPEVVEAMMNVLRFWIQRGVDGFRIDAISYLFEDERLRDEPLSSTFNPKLQSHYRRLSHVHTVNVPETLGMIRRFGNLAEETNLSLVVTESPSGEPLNSMLNMYRTVTWKNYMPFNFSFIKLPWSGIIQKDSIDHYIEALGTDYIPNFVTGNHDKSRIATRLGEAQARIAAMLQMTLPGVAFMYNGEEIGMTDTDIPHSKAVDTYELQNPGKGLGRDPERTPLQWNDETYAGFSTSEPWLPINTHYKDVNIESQKNNPVSFLSLYRLLIALRKKHPAFQGVYVPLPSPAKNVVIFLRKNKERTVLVILNFDNLSKHISLPYSAAKLLLNQSGEKPETPIDLKERILQGNEGMILEVED